MVQGDTERHGAAEDSIVMSEPLMLEACWGGKLVNFPNITLRSGRVVPHPAPKMPKNDFLQKRSRIKITEI